MAKVTRKAFAAALAAVSVAATLTIGAGFALADPEPLPSDPVVDTAPTEAPIDPAAAPGDPVLVDPAVVDPAVPVDPAIPVDPAEAPLPTDPATQVLADDAPVGEPGATATYVGPTPFLPPSFSPLNGVHVGVAKPIVINFQRPILNKPLAESAITITSDPPATGRFYWESDTQLRWRPDKFWAPNTVVNIDAAGTKSMFTTHDALVATVDNSTHQMVITRNDKVIKTFPVSMGKPGDDTPNGTYYASEKFADMWMDSSTYGVPIDDPDGYRVKVLDAVRISNTGIFVHGAPWSVGAQGNSNVSHGCINLSAENAQWFYDNYDLGDPVIVKNSVGTYNQRDGYDDWQRF